MALVGGTLLAVACIGRSPLAVALVGGSPLAAPCIDRTRLAVALVGGSPLAVAHAVPPAVVSSVITRTEVVRDEVACAGAFPRPSRAPRILADPNRPAILARAHGAILKICYKIVNKLREYSDHVSWNLRHPIPTAP